MTITGTLAVGEKRREIREIISPNTNSPKSIDFEISITGDPYGPIQRRVEGHFTHLHKITNESVPDDWTGMLGCEWWGKRMHKWHVTFTRFAAGTEPDHNHAD